MENESNPSESMEGICEHGNFQQKCGKCIFDLKSNKDKLSNSEIVEQTISQKIGIATILSNIETQAKAGVEMDNLNKILNEGVSKFNLNAEQKLIIEKGLSEFKEKNQAINNYVDKYKEEFGENWQTKLFENSFGVKPVGKINIRIGPMTLYWQCTELEDYAVATDQELEDAKLSFGFRKSPLDFHLEGLRGTMIIEYSGHSQHIKNNEESQDKKSKITEVHEEQHIIYDMMPNQLNYDALGWPGLDENSNEEEVKSRLLDFIKIRRQEIEGLLKNEILAYWKDGEKTPDQIMDEMMIPGGLYDNTEVVSEEGILKYLVSRFGDRYKDIVPKLGVDSLWKGELKIKDNNIRKAIDVIKNIEVNNSTKKQEYIYLLMMEPLDKWPRALRHTANKI